MMGERLGQVRDVSLHSHGATAVRVYPLAVEGVPRRVYRCAGAVITHFHVLTAAHCVKNLPENFEL